MEITWFGATCVRLKGREGVVAADAYRSVVGPTGRGLTADICTYSHADAGRCIFTGDTPEALDMSIAGAVTDCLKRCFRQLGEQFGNSLYDKEVAKTAGLENGATNGHGSNGNGQSEKSTGQSASPNPPAPPNPPASQAETLQYRDGTAVDTSNAAELEAFNAFKSANQELAPASREVLRAWVASRNGKK